MLRADWTRSLVARYFLTTACSRRMPRVVKRNRHDCGFCNNIFNSGSLRPVRPTRPGNPISGQRLHI